MFVCMFVPRISPKRNALAISKILHNILMPILGQRYYFQVAILFKRRNMGRIHFQRYFEVISITYRRQKREAAANTLVPDARRPRFAPSQMRERGERNKREQRFHA